MFPKHTIKLQSYKVTAMMHNLKNSVNFHILRSKVRVWEKNKTIKSIHKTHLISNKENNEGLVKSFQNHFN